jgi:hypothetical protein
MDDAMRWVLGRAVADIKNLKVLGEDGQEKAFKLELDGDRLTEGSYQELSPIVNEIVGCILTSGRVTAQERKNF